MKKIVEVLRNDHGHWVGDGFPVRTLISYQMPSRHISPFLLLDYAGPVTFEPAERPRGVGRHPHRGFETVTIVYEGEVEHGDSAGNHGKIGPGDVQWMTAASGIVHEEFHSHDFTARGGRFEMVQLWVNLPAAKKMSPPGYQEILDRDIPRVPVPEGGTARVIAGERGDARGPARTFTPMNVWDLRLEEGSRAGLTVPREHNTLLAVLRGPVRVNGSEPVESASVVRLGDEGTRVVVESEGKASVLLLTGERIEEPVVGRGPFVMNTMEEIHQAMDDYATGRMG